MPKRSPPPRVLGGLKAPEELKGTELTKAIEATLTALKQKQAQSGDWRHWLGPRPDGQLREPHEKQKRFLDLDCLEALFGGSAGPGKSEALLMAALQYVHVPGYAGLLLRRTYADLALPGAIMDRAKEWWIPKGVTWNAQDKRFTFPSGATITFGYLDTDADKYRYQSSEFTFIGFDELTQFGEGMYRYLFSRLRRLQGSSVPLRIRAASNPGGIGHDWVRRRFIENTETGRAFVPALLSDNPFLDAEAYKASLAQLDPTTRKQLLEGLWIRDAAGLVYGRFDEALNMLDELPKLKLDYYILGIDYGFTDATAFTVLGWMTGCRTVYVCESFKMKGLSPTEAAEGVARLNEKYEFCRMVGDVGGIGKGYAEEARRRFALPIEPAEKHNKRGYIDLLNGALKHRELMLVRGLADQLAEEWLELPWQKGRRKEEAEAVHEEADGFENHCADSCLYGWRACMAYGEEAPIARPEVNTKAYYDEIQEMMLEQAEKKYEERKDQNWWER